MKGPLSFLSSLQYGVPLQTLVDKFSHSRFEPSGMTKNPEVRFAKSIIDYIFRWMATKFLSPEAQYRAGVNLREKAEDDDRRTLQPTAPPRSAPSPGPELESAPEHVCVQRAIQYGRTMARPTTCADVPRHHVRSWCHDGRDSERPPAPPAAETRASRPLHRHRGATQASPAQHHDRR